MIPINISDYIWIYVHLDKDTYEKVFLNIKKHSQLGYDITGDIH